MNEGAHLGPLASLLVSDQLGEDSMQPGCGAEGSGWCGAELRRRVCSGSEHQLKKKKSLMCSVFANFCGINSPPGAYFKLPVGHRVGKRWVHVALPRCLG